MYALHQFLADSVEYFSLLVVLTLRRSCERPWNPCPARLLPHRRVTDPVTRDQPKRVSIKTQKERWEKDEVLRKSSFSRTIHICSLGSIQLASAGGRRDGTVRPAHSTISDHLPGLPERFSHVSSHLQGTRWR